MPPPADASDPLAAFSPATAAWFRGAFAAPTPAQTGAWAAVADGRDALVVAPTGSGKTLAAFLWSLDRIAAEPVPADPQRRCRVLYVSPLKALAVDVERNLRSPLTGIRREAARLGLGEPVVDVAIRTGDTSPADRRRQATRPPDVLITTPESLFLLLTSQARESLRGVDTVIVDEVHAVAGTKRGAHLALSLERLDALLDAPARRIGLSATVRPVQEVARFLGGTREVRVVAPASEKVIDLQVVVPVDDLAAPAAPAGAADSDPAAPAPASIWPHVEEAVVDLVASHRSTLVFANSRRLAERLTARLNEIWHERLTGEVLGTGGAPAASMGQAGSSGGAPAVLARAHHGSVSKEQRALIEDDLKSGRLPAVVATSSLELGIDMGAVDLVVQVESPPSVASGLQRVGRAGHQVGAVSHGVVFPKFRGDLVQAAVVAESMRAGLIEALRVPRNPLDVLAQQVVAMVSVDEWAAEDLLALVRRAAPFASLPDSAFAAVLDMVSGTYPSDEFAELRPRLVHDRATGMLTARPGAQRLAVTSGGTIPDRGLFGVFLIGSTTSRVGELDEEMVYESRVGDVFTLGASSWRIEEITHDRVLVSPAPGQAGRLPFWHGDSLGRPAELGRAVGAFVREVSIGADDAVEQRLRAIGLDDRARDNLRRYLREQAAATGVVPDDTTLVVERTRDELGDWRLVVHSPYGAQVHAPWAMVLSALVRDRFGIDAQVMHADDGIVLRLPDTDDNTTVDAVAAALLLDPDDVERLVTEAVTGSALFAARFRECAARALLLPRRDPGRRSPLWQQRQRSAQLLSVASRFGSFPIVLETVRECLQDVFDVPALVRLMRELDRRSVRIVDVTTELPSPFARSLLFGYVASFLYEGDSPLAERRAQALALDPTLLAELLGHTELRELLDSDVLAQLERELARLTPERRARHAEDASDLLRLQGPLDLAHAEARGVRAEWLEHLESTRRAIRVRVAGAERWAAVEDAGRLRDGLGTALPVGLPDAFLAPVPDPVADLVARYARWHGPFTATEVAQWLGLGVSVARAALERLAASGRVLSGDFRPGGSGTEWCDAEVMRTLRRRSVAALRHEAEPVFQHTLGRFLPSWQHIAVAVPSTSTPISAPVGAAPAGRRPVPARPRLRGVDGVLAAVAQLAGAELPAQSLESVVLPARVLDYSPAMLDELTAAGEVVWWGLGALPSGDGWMSLAPAEMAPPLLPLPPAVPDRPLAEAVLGIASLGGGWFFRDLSARVGSELGPVDDADLEAVLWSLVWSGRLTNDTIAPLRALGSGAGRRPAARAARLRRPPRARPTFGGGTLARRPAMPSRSGPATAAGRWSALPVALTDPTVRAAALTDVMLHRHGVLTRGAVAGEGAAGGFAAAYTVLRALADSGRVTRGYVVEGLGASQFALPGAIDLLRSFGDPSPRSSDTPTPLAAVVLAAADPANPYGAALPWPQREQAPSGAAAPQEAPPSGPRTDETAQEAPAGGHRPGRRAGALVVLVDGHLVLFLERGGRSVLTWTHDAVVLTAAAAVLADAARDGRLGTVTVERVDGSSASTSTFGGTLESVGFHRTPKGLRLRA